MRFTALPAAALLEGAVTLSFLTMGLAMVLGFYRLVRGPTLPDRIVAFDLIGTLTVGAIAVYCLATDQPILLDAATVVALVAFLGTVAFAHYLRALSGGPVRESVPGPSTEQKHD